MGFLTNNTETSAQQILSLKSEALDAINKLTYTMNLYKSQLANMENNSDYSQEDKDEMQDCINELQTGIDNI